MRKLTDSKIKEIGSKFIRDDDGKIYMPLSTKTAVSDKPKPQPQPQQPQPQPQQKKQQIDPSYLFEKMLHIIDNESRNSSAIISVVEQMNKRKKREFTSTVIRGSDGKIDKITTKEHD